MTRESSWIVTILIIIASEMTDIELQKTNTTLRRLSDEMRSYSIERSKEREEELRVEVDRIHSEIKLLQRTNEDSATVSDKLSREVSTDSTLHYSTL